MIFLMGSLMSLVITTAEHDKVIEHTTSQLEKRQTIDRQTVSGFEKCILYMEC